MSMVAESRLASWTLSIRRNWHWHWQSFLLVHSKPEAESTPPLLAPAEMHAKLWEPHFLGDPVQNSVRSTWYTQLYPPQNTHFLLL